MVQAIFYQEDDGTCPVLKFLLKRAPDVQAKARVCVQLLRDRGHDLRRPYAENIGGGLYELRWRVGRVQYRILYFFHGREAVILTHALTKEAQIPRSDIDRALRRKSLFQQNPKQHTHPVTTL